MALDSLCLVDQVSMHRQKAVSCGRERVIERVYRNTTGPKLERGWKCSYSVLLDDLQNCKQG